MEIVKAKEGKAKTKAAPTTVVSEVEDDELEDLEEVEDRTTPDEEEEEKVVKDVNNDEKRDKGLLPSSKEDAVSFSGSSENGDKGSVNIAWDAIESRPGSSGGADKSCEGKEEEEEQDEDMEDDLAEDINEIADFIRSSGQEEKAMTKAAPAAAATTGKTIKRKRKAKSRKTLSKRTKTEKELPLPPPPLTKVPVVDVDANLPPSSSNSSSSKQRVVAVKPVQNWRKVLKLPNSLDDRLNCSQIFNPSLPTYVPHVPRGTSQRLIDHLTEREVELLCCPGCKDHFVLPTTFFQHVYRKSVSITFSCLACRGGQVLTFHNRCHLKMHVLSHLEVDGVSTVASNFVNVEPLRESEFELGFADETHERELDEAHKTCLQSEKDVVQCTECRLSVGADCLQQHFERNKGSHECDSCHATLPNPCSASAHARIHARTLPHVCPDCGVRFETLSVFRSHVENSCHHDSRTLALECRVCTRKGSPQPFIDARDILSHMYDSHIKLYYKCSSCPKAFDSKAVIYEHRDEKHAQEVEGEKSDFSLLYKATFIKAPENLFNSRDSFERKMVGISRRWRSAVMYRCAACRTFFASREEIAGHNRRWCGIQQTGGGASASGSSASASSKPHSSLLFPSEEEETLLRERKAKIGNLISEMKTLLGPDCGDCGAILERLSSHASEHLDKQQQVKKELESDSGSTKPSTEDNGPSCSGSTRPERSSTRRTTMARSLSKEPASTITPKLQQQQPQQQQQQSQNPEKKLPAKSEPRPATATKAIKVEVKEDGVNEKSKKNKEKSKSTNAAHKTPRNEVKPFVESLGKDIPSARRILAFNQLDRQALALGSSVVDSQRSLKKGRSSKHCCGLCDFGTDLRESFQTHIRIHRPREVGRGEYFQCKECGMSFASEPAWRKHLFLLHRIKNPDPAAYCSDLSSSTTAVASGGVGDKAMAISSKDPFSFNEADDDSSGGEPALTIDEGEVFKPRTNVCTVCARAFSTPLELRKHFRGHGMAFLMTAKK